MSLSAFDYGTRHSATALSSHRRWSGQAQSSRHGQRLSLGRCGSISYNSRVVAQKIEVASSHNYNPLPQHTFAATSCLSMPVPTKNLVRGWRRCSASLKEGKHRDGQGLQFEVKGGSRRWTFSYMFEGRQRELAIGKYPAMSLADARAKRAELREAKDRGLDTKAVLAGAIVPNRTVTFRQDMDTFVAHMRGQWTARPSEGLAAVRGSDCRSADGQGHGQSDAGRRAERHQAGLGNHQRDRTAGAGTHRADDRARHGR